MISLRKAEINEAERILEFYRDIINSIENSEFKPKWNESYPDLEYIEACIEKGEMYTCTTDNDMISCIVLNNGFDSEPEQITWCIDAEPDEITVIHTFAVNSEFSGKGIGKEIFDRIELNAIKNNKKSMRIDIVDGNVGAERFFEKLGFEYVDSVETFHEAVGFEKFHFYELVLKEEKK